MIRSTLDALTTAGFLEDGARVVHIDAVKNYARERTGAIVTVRPSP